MKTTLLIFLTILLFSCRKEVKSERGGIDLVSNVYADASDGLDKMQTFHLSKINYLKDEIIEIVPDPTVPEMNRSGFYIRDTLFYPLDLDSGNNLLSHIVQDLQPSAVRIKKTGAVFSDEMIPNYRNRQSLSDTVLFRKKYRRFEINSPWSYTRYYIYPTDTILPYSLYRHAETDYGGRLERIDSYDRKSDMFITLQLLPRKNWDEIAKDIFEFNEYVDSRTVD